MAVTMKIMVFHNLSPCWIYGTITNTLHMQGY